LGQTSYKENRERGTCYSQQVRKCGYELEESYPDRQLPVQKQIMFQFLSQTTAIKRTDRKHRYLDFINKAALQRGCTFAKRDRKNHAKPYISQLYRT